MITEETFELRMERAAHRETRQHLARALHWAQYYQSEAVRLGFGNDEPLPNPLPNQHPLPPPIPVPDGESGELVVMSVVLMRVVSQLAAELALGMGGTPDQTEISELTAAAQLRLDMLVSALDLATAGTPPGEGQGGGG
jgi:hypothetical protein